MVRVMVTAEVPVDEMDPDEKYIISPENNYVRLWNTFVAFVCMITSALVVYMASFNSTDAALWVLVYIGDVVYIIDMILTFFTGYASYGQVVMNRKKVCKRYLKKRFIIDLLSALPTDLLVFAVPGVPKWQLLAQLRNNRVIRFYRMTSFLGQREDELGTNTVLLRAFKYTVICTMYTHVITCIWYSLACTGNHQDTIGRCFSGSWATTFSLGFNLTLAEPIDAYVVSLYWATATATSTGYGDIHASNLGEKWFSIGAMLLGIAVFFGMLLGGMTSMMTNFDTQRARYIHRLKTIKQHLTDFEVPVELRELVESYYNYMWVRSKGISSEGILDALPMVFKAEISLETNKIVLDNAPIFKGLDPGFLRMLSLNIKQSLYLPCQVIVNRGDVGHTMYFIHRGEVEVLSEEDDETAIATMKDGKLFGEMSVIYGVPRTATIRAATHCDLMVLDKMDLHKVLQHYPKVAELLKIKAEERYRGLQGTDMDKLMAQEAPKKDPKDRMTRLGSFAIKESDRKHSVIHPKPSIKTEQSVDLYAVPEELTAAFIGVDTGNPFTRKMRSIKDFFTYIIQSEFDPSSKFILGWEIAVTITAIIIAFLYPFIAAFLSYGNRTGYSPDNGGSSLLAVSYIFDLILLVDILIKLRTAVPTPYGLQKDFKFIAKNYIFSFEFVVDILAILPLEFASLHWSEGLNRWHYLAFFRLNRLIKFGEVLQVFGKMEGSIHVSMGTIRFSKFLLYICIFSHWCACVMWMGACSGAGCKDTSWTYNFDNLNNLIIANHTSVNQYITSLYYAAATMTSTGYGEISAYTTLGRLLSLISMLIGLLIYGYVLAAMAALLANNDAPKVNFQGRLFAVRNFMLENSINQELRNRVINYLCVLWEKHKGEWIPGQRPLLHDMPVAVQQDITYNDALHTIGQVPLFKDTDDKFLRELSLKAQLYVFSPGDTIIYAGDMGREMYIIRKGICEIYSSDMKRVYASIGPGHYFGEVGLIFGDYRTASVRSMTHTEILMLNKTDLDEVLKDFPLLRKQFTEADDKKEYAIKMQRELAKRINQGSKHTVKSFVDVSKSIIEEKEPTPIEEQEGKKIDSLESIAKFYKKLPVGGTNFDYVNPFYNLNPVARAFSFLLLNFTFLPTGLGIKIWQVVRVFIAMIVTFTVALQAAFLYTDSALWTINYFFDVICITDLYLSFHIAYYNENKVLVTHPLSTAEHYLKSNFLLDLLSCFPFEIFAYAAVPNFSDDALHLFAIVRLLRMVQIYRLPLAFNYLESGVEKDTGVIRQIKFGFYTVVFMHLVTCGIFLLACPPSVLVASDLETLARHNETQLYPHVHSAVNHLCLANSWAVNENFEMGDADASYLYAVSFYWASATVASVGYGEIHAHTTVEMVIALMIMIIGVVFFGYIIASVAASLANADAARARYQEKMSGIKNLMRDYKLDTSLRKRVELYYNYVWIRTKGVDPETLFNGLPIALWGDVTLSLYEDIISKVPLFKGTEISFMKMLSRCIKPLLFLKGEYIVKKFDVGSEMFFINRGFVEVVSEDGKMIFDTMRAGRFFGEVALLFNCPRTASIRCGSNCDVFMLTKTDLDNVLKYYPQIKEQVLRIAEERRQQAQKRSAARIKTQAVVAFAAKPAATLAPPAPAAPGSNSTTSTSNNNNNSNKNNNNNTNESATLRDPMNISFTDLAPESLGADGDNRNNSARNKNNNNDDKKEEKKEEKEPTRLERLLKLNRFTLDPAGKFCTNFASISCFLSVLTGWTIFYEVAYQDHHFVYFIINYIAEAFFIAELYIKFHRSYVNPFGDVVTDFKEVYQNYLKSPGGFALDLITCVPLEIFALTAGQPDVLLVFSYIRLVKLIRLIRVLQYFGKREQELNTDLLYIRLIKFGVILGLCIHFFGCIWYMLACPSGSCQEGTWVAAEAWQDGVEGMMIRYCTCIYWTVATMTSTGYGDIHAYNPSEMVFASVVMVFGKLMLGFILGNIASTLANAEAQRVNYDEKLDAIKEHMKESGTPARLQNHVINYYDYLWQRNHGVDSKALLRDAPTCLLSEVWLTIGRQMLEQIPLFEDAENSFFCQMALRVRITVFTPGDYIVQKGDLSHEVYYINRGKAEELTEDQPPLVEKILPTGTVFCEDALARSCPHLKSIRARTHVDIFTVNKEDLDTVLHYYPSFQATIVERIRARFGSSSHASSADPLGSVRVGGRKPMQIIKPLKT